MCVCLVESRKICSVSVKVSVYEIDFLYQVFIHSIDHSINQRLVKKQTIFSENKSWPGFIKIYKNWSWSRRTMVC